MKDYVFTSSFANLGLTEKCLDFNTYSKSAISTKIEKIYSNEDIEINRINFCLSDHVIIGINVLKKAIDISKQYSYQLLEIKDIREIVSNRMNKKHKMNINPEI
ncbi:hypothetical protein DMUE_0563 [Dictyocoela muelleri]|nr:hypothetical protein DMUE_0563 [Dictyocoela muelleri]